MKSALLLSAMLVSSAGASLPLGTDSARDAVAPPGGLVIIDASQTAPPDPPMPTPATIPPEVGINSAAGGLHRCIAGDGVTIFTDRRCEDLQAVESQQQGSALRPSLGSKVRSCAHNRDDLLFGVRMALEAHDVNRFADYYNWAGMSNAEGYRLIERLNSFAGRPLVDVQLVSSRAPAVETNPFEPQFDEDGNLAAAPPPRRAADLLRVDQMRADDDISSQVTYFHLRTNAGCLWLQL